jgi:hypothetical protein
MKRGNVRTYIPPITRKPQSYVLSIRVGRQARSIRVKMLKVAVSVLRSYTRYSSNGSALYAYGYGISYLAASAGQVPVLCIDLYRIICTNASYPLSAFHITGVYVYALAVGLPGYAHMLGRVAQNSNPGMRSLSWIRPCGVDLIPNKDPNDTG